MKLKITLDKYEPKLSLYSKIKRHLHWKSSRLRLETNIPCQLNRIFFSLQKIIIR